MRNSWYYRCAGLETGPVVFEKIVELVRSGRIAHSDELRRSDEQSWRLASEVEGLFREQVDTRQSEDELFDDILNVAAADDGSHVSGQRVGTLLEDQIGSDPHSNARVTKYYCRIQGKESGPFTLSELQQRADDGLMTPFDRVRLVDGKAWIPAQEISEIRFSTSSAASPPAEKSRSQPAPQGNPKGDRQRPAEAKQKPSVESVIDDVLLGGSDARESAPVSESSPKAEIRQVPPSIDKAESYGKETEPRRSAVSTPPVSVPPVAPSRKTATKERRVSKSGSGLKFQMPGTGLLSVLIGVLVLAAVITWMRREGTPPINGEVKVDGQPVPVGSISFMPISGTKNDPLTIAIESGRFAGGPNDTLVGGKYKVRVIIGLPLGNPPSQLTSVPTFAELNGAVFEKEIDTTSGDENLFVFEFPAADAKMQSDAAGNAFSLE